VGVKLERLLVVRPPLEALTRVALRVVESQCFAVVVIDTIGMPGAELKVPLGRWSRVVRRLALALEKTQSTVLLITDSSARRPFTLPVAQRIELNRTRAHKLILQVAKDKRGRIAAPCMIALQHETLVQHEVRTANATVNQLYHTHTKTQFHTKPWPGFKQVVSDAS
jgi:recombination protein RecA